MANTGIIHAAHTTGGLPFCKTRRSIASLNLAEFLKCEEIGWKPCKKCQKRAERQAALKEKLARKG